MDLLRWMGVTFARFVGFVVMILGAWIFFLNVVQVDYQAWVLVWILVSGLAGGLGGLAYLLSFDGPKRFRTRKMRFGGWLGMLASALLPTALTLMILPMVAVVSPMWPYLRITSE